MVTVARGGPPEPRKLQGAFQQDNILVMDDTALAGPANDCSHSIAAAANCAAIGHYARSPHVLRTPFRDSDASAPIVREIWLPLGWPSKFAAKLSAGLTYPVGRTCAAGSFRINTSQ
jgi:hypothetical protein